MRLNNIIDLNPLIVEEKFGAEPSLRELIDKYYQPHFPQDYKSYTLKYIEKMQEMLDAQLIKDSGSLKVDDKIEVVFEVNLGDGEFFNDYGINLGDRGVVNSVDTSQYPVSVRFENGHIWNFKEIELRKIND